mmetsp:Transcript_31447/g.45262  ORF Transcript_31447/g.45262 Transcript_31447/m.45262 type:complete len:223 (-) Transcript_31447:68-736(-)
MISTLLLLSAFILCSVSSYRAFQFDIANRIYRPHRDVTACAMFGEREDLSGKKIYGILLSSLFISFGSNGFISPAPVRAVEEVTAQIPTLSPSLTAADLLKNDITPKVDTLNDILFVLKLYPSYAEKGDYVSIRQSLRQEPAMNLRKTCKKLEKYLPDNVQKQFSASYASMIDSLNEMDVIALQRMQGSGLPADNTEDITLSKAIAATVSNYEKMLNTLSSI